MEIMSVSICNRIYVTTDITIPLVIYAIFLIIKHSLFNLSHLFNDIPIKVELN